jgi:hypothetical protein
MLILLAIAIRAAGVAEARFPGIRATLAGLKIHGVEITQAVYWPTDCRLASRVEPESVHPRADSRNCKHARTFPQTAQGDALAGVP